ncbi:MAG: hypothetical protein QOI17_29, partial [Gaiellales bacterium]|nr:hypothetical protein [Gaiellales bacterium]
ALVFDGTELVEVVGEGDDCRAFRVDVDGETPLVVRGL